MPIKWFNCLVTGNPPLLAQGLCGLDKTTLLSIKYVLQAFRDSSPRSNPASRVLPFLFILPVWVKIKEPSF
jgi:hypothetical protein